MIGTSRYAMTGEMLLRAAEMQEADRRAVAGGTPGLELMRSAGQRVAEAASAMVGTGRVLVLCGPGNNGGDGFVAAGSLQRAGCEVGVVALLAPSLMQGDAAIVAREWSGAVAAAAEIAVGEHDLIVDALFGTGLARDLDGPVADLVRRANEAGCPVLAVDIPSGIDSDTGGVRGVAVRATRTVALAARKPGHLLYPGREHCGRVEVAEIGIAAQLLRQCGSGLVVNGPDLWTGALPRLGSSAHKYDRGHAVVLSGGPAHTGAARLAARGALRAGAGLVTLVTSARALAVNAAHLTAIMLKVADDPDELSDLLTDDRFNALALGPALGVGEATRGWVAAALEADRATVLDADALTSFSGDVDALAQHTRSTREHPVILTPHEGELTRLFAGPGEGSEEARALAALPSKLERARQAAAFTGAVVVVKGADTVIASPDGRAAINENGTPVLATAGSGDVLGGMAAGLLAQGMPGFEAAAAAVWMHAEAGARFGPGLIAEDLPEMLPPVLRALHATI